jgi:hypothetical protein
LTLNNSSAGVVNFSVTANPAGSRAATVTVLGRSVVVTQTLVVTGPLLARLPRNAGNALILTFAANPNQVVSDRERADRGGSVDDERFPRRPADRHP